MSPIHASLLAIGWLLVALFFFGVFSCSKQKYQGSWYTIKQGDHYSDGRIGKLYGRDNKKFSWIFEVEFEDNALYKKTDLIESCQLHNDNG